MRLQISIDLTSTEDALALAGAVAPYADVLEAGTPLIKQVGLGIVAELRRRHPDKLIFADLKTMDAGEMEAALAFEAGADLVTVLGLASDRTIRGAVAAAKLHGKEVVADLIGVHDHGRRASHLETLGVHAITVHAGLDEQAEGLGPLADVAEVRAATRLPLLIEGGINAATILQARDAGASTVAVGHAVYSARDPAAEAAELRRLIDSPV